MQSQRSGTFRGVCETLSKRHPAMVLCVEARRVIEPSGHLTYMQHFAGLILSAPPSTLVTYTCRPLASVNRRHLDLGIRRCHTSVPQWSYRLVVVLLSLPIAIHVHTLTVVLRLAPVVVQHDLHHLVVQRHHHLSAHEIAQSRVALHEL